MVAAAAGATALYYGATWRGFDPKTVRVSGNRVVSSAEIVARAGISRTANVWLQNMGTAASRVRAIPYIGNVWIHRSLPAAVTIVVTERTPAAIVNGASDSAVIDDSLRVLQNAAAGSTLPKLDVPASLPAPGGYVKDERVRRLLDDDRALTAAHAPVAVLQYDRFEDVVATMRNGVRLLLGDDTDRFAQKCRLIAPILSQIGASHRPVAALDLRAPDAPVVEYRQ